MRHSILKDLTNLQKGTITFLDMGVIAGMTPGVPSISIPFHKKEIKDTIWPAFKASISTISPFGLNLNSQTLNQETIKLQQENKELSKQNANLEKRNTDLHNKCQSYLNQIDDLKRLIEEKNKLLKERERLINVLMNK